MMSWRLIAVASSQSEVLMSVQIQALYRQHMPIAPWLTPLPWCTRTPCGHAARILQTVRRPTAPHERPENGGRVSLRRQCTIISKHQYHPLCMYVVCIQVRMCRCTLAHLIHLTSVYSAEEWMFADASHINWLFQRFNALCMVAWRHLKVAGTSKEPVSCGTAFTNKLQHALWTLSLSAWQHIITVYCG